MPMEGPGWDLVLPSSKEMAVLSSVKREELWEAEFRGW